MANPSHLVIVESPAKAKTINKYLGNDYIVLASYGHVRDLSPKDGSVDPENDFAMKWQLSERAEKNVKEIIKAAKHCHTIYLTTDPDREGEAISWHIQEILEEQKLTVDRNIERVTFNEITKSAVQTAFKEPRQLDSDLIDAYKARRALDYLYGFTLSPILWRKLPGSKSAGRVQSPALRLICEREEEIEAFKAQEYWSLTAHLHSADGAPFTARLTHLSGNKLDKLAIGNEEEAQAAEKRIRNKALSIQNIEKKQVKRNPAAPFITSTLQQEAARKLYFSASQTMRLAQQLYEGTDIGGETVGLITYMRTDGITLSGEAIAQARDVIGDVYGKEFVPDSPRAYKSKAKNAQEAHEAIRPTDLRRTPQEMRKYLDERQAKLYELIWKRTIACQMEAAIMDQMAVDISDGTDDVILRANGSVVTFEGFLKVYEEGQDDVNENTDDKDRRLPPLKEGDNTKLQDVLCDQHFTQPPPRYTEASLVKKLEEEGIGRPSTYASILQVLQDRNYVRLDKRRFTPEDRGRLVTVFLKNYFTRYVDLEFTAQMEEELDAISAGNVTWHEALRQFWVPFSRAVAGTKDLTITEVLDKIDEELGPHFFAVTEENPNPRKCPGCDDGKLSVKLGKFGGFIGCSNYPDCKYTKPLEIASDDESAAEAKAQNEGPKILGEDPKSGKTVSLRVGPYGPYVQLDNEEGDKSKPKRQGLPKGTNYDDVTLESALGMLALPRDVGKHPESGEMIQAGIGRFGPYLKVGKNFTSLPKDDDLMTIGVNRAVTVIAEAAEKKAAKAAAGKGKKAPAKKAPTKKKKPATKKK